MLDCAWKVEPVTLGPTWAKSETGSFLMPEHTLAWQIFAWIEGMPDYGRPAMLLGDDGEPFKLTREQKRFVAWWYAIDEHGRFLYRDGVLQRLKGWGKDPLLAVICAVEFLGPCRFAGWATRDMPELGLKKGDPVGKEVPSAWIDIAAVSLKQTRNTMQLFPSLFSDACKREHEMNGQSIGKTVVYAHRGARQISAVTSSPAALEGGRATFVVRNETHHWIESNNGHEMAAVIERNATKSKGGASRALSITNAYEPSQDSVAQRQREAWEKEHTGQSISTGVLYDSLEIGLEWGLVPPEVREDPDMPVEEIERLTRAYLGEILRVARGDSWWLDIPRLTDSILDAVNPPSRSRRFWFNQIRSAEDAWVDPVAVDAGEDPLAISERKLAAAGSYHESIRAGWLVGPHDEIVMFGDGSKSDDMTALVGCRLSDGYVFLIGAWGRPEGLDPKKKWYIPRNEVHLRVQEAMNRFNVVGFWFDPSHALDEQANRYWDGYCDKWHREYGDNLRFWAVKTGNMQHSVMWDMTSPERSQAFAEAAEVVCEEIEHRPDETTPFTPQFSHDGHPLLKTHLKNCRRSPQIFGKKTLVSIRKDGPDSPRKIDIAACVIGARMLRRIATNIGVEQQEVKGGWAEAL